MREIKIPSPNFIDRAIEFYDPIRGMKRRRARTALAISGGYTGASKTKRSLKQWLTGANPGSPDADTIDDLPTLRGRSRDLIRNDPLATGSINTNCTNVVGTGIRLQSHIDRTILNLSDDAANEWESNIEREWRLFSESTECDAARTLNFYGLQDLVFRQVLERKIGPTIF